MEVENRDRGHRKVAGFVFAGFTRLLGIVFVAMFLCAATILSAAGTSEAAELRLLHSPVSNVVSGNETRIIAALSEDAEVSIAEVRFRFSRTGEFLPSILSGEPTRLEGWIPGAPQGAEVLQYYIYVETPEGDVATYPAENPQANPIEVDISAGAAFFDPIYPLHGEVIDETRPEICGILEPPLLEGDQLVVLLDGADITDSLFVSSDYFLYAPKRDLAPGPHKVVVALDKVGGEALRGEWSFRIGVAGKYLEVPEENWFSGEISVGFCTVSADTVESDTLATFPPYREGDFPLVEAYAYGSYRGLDIDATLSSDRIYDNEVRYSGRISGSTFGVEVGDLYPSFSENTLYWSFGKGAGAWKSFGRHKTEAVFMRTGEADTTFGVGIYSRYLGGLRQSYSPRNATIGLSVLYGFDREGSVPESLRFTPAADNVVAGADADVKVWRALNAFGEATYSRYDEYDTDEDYAYRAGLSWGRAGKKELSLTYRSIGPEFESMGSLTTGAGEEGWILDGRIQTDDGFDGNIKTEIYRDYGDAQPLESGRYVFELYLRSSLLWELAETKMRTYIIGQFYQVPYESHDYRSAYVTLGFHNSLSFITSSVSITRTVTESDEDRKGWSTSGYVRTLLLKKRLTLKLSGTYSMSNSEDEGETNRKQLRGQARYKAGSWRFNAEYIRAERSGGDEPYTEDVFRFSIGRAFHGL
jgi:hypothetical protein